MSSASRQWLRKTTPHEAWVHHDWCKDATSLRIRKMSNAGTNTIRLLAVTKLRTLTQPLAKRAGETRQLLSALEHPSNRKKDYGTLETKNGIPLDSNEKHFRRETNLWYSTVTYTVVGLVKKKIQAFIATKATIKSHQTVEIPRSYAENRNLMLSSPAAR